MGFRWPWAYAESALLGLALKPGNLREVNRDAYGRRTGVPPQFLNNSGKESDTTEV